MGSDHYPRPSTTARKASRLIGSVSNSLVVIAAEGEQANELHARMRGEVKCRLEKLRLSAFRVAEGAHATVPVEHILASPDALEIRAALGEGFGKRLQTDVSRIAVEIRPELRKQAPGALGAAPMRTALRTLQARTSTSSRRSLPTSAVVSPEASLPDTWLQTLELLRDPSHVHDASTTEWDAALSAAGLAIERTEHFRLRNLGRTHEHARAAGHHDPDAPGKGRLGSEGLFRDGGGRQFYRRHGGVGGAK